MKTQKASHELSTPPASPRAWQLAQLAAMMMEKTAIRIRSDGEETLDTHNRKVELEWRLHDAEYLLLAAERASRFVHAYELFPDDLEFISIDKMKKRFASVGWHGLTSWASCENLLGEILKSLRERVRVPDLEYLKESGFLDILPKLEDRTKTAFWVSPDSLVNETAKKYRVRTILLLAHLFCRENFRNRIEIGPEKLGRKKVL